MEAILIIIGVIIIGLITVFYKKGIKPTKNSGKSYSKKGEKEIKSE